MVKAIDKISGSLLIHCEERSDEASNKYNQI